MDSFIQDGTTVECLKPSGSITPRTSSPGGAGTIRRSWQPCRWSTAGRGHLWRVPPLEPPARQLSWVDHDGRTNWAWIRKDYVCRATEPEWDLDQFGRCAEVNRVIQWGDRFPALLPEAT
jgi:hypothetical protein